jgi:hypothetical protein
MGKRGKAEKQAARTARLSAALRENLKRRKAQARSRAATSNVDANQSAEAGPGTGPTAVAEGHGVPITRRSSRSERYCSGSSRMCSAATNRTPDFRRNRGRE